MRDKVLICYEESQIKPVGGPSGYLYNLKEGLKNIKGDIVIEFLPASEKEERLSKLRRGYQYLSPEVVKKIQLHRTYKKYKNIVNGKKKDVIQNIEQYKAIHFHSTIALYRYKEQLEAYSGKVIITSHTPKAPHKETIEDVFYGKHKNLEKLLETVDKYAFERADYIIFPCEQAEEPYDNTWGDYRCIKEKNKNKYRYILTGCIQKKSKKTREEVREKYNISFDKFVVSYVGRHNEVKGYDSLKKMAARILNIKDDVFFLIAGKEEPLKGLKSQNWKEAGWINDAESVINAADVFILPNKETYFDLVLLEVLSMGKPVIISRTGGNKFFEKLNSDGIYVYESEKEAVDIILKMKEKGMEELENLGQMNQTIYEKYFTPLIFAQNYIKLLKDILSKEE